MKNNIARDLYNPGTDITVVADTDLKGRTFVALTGDTAGGNVVVRTASTGDLPAGVAKYDAPAGELVGLARGSARVVLMATSDTLSVGQPVTIGTEGQAVAVTTSEDGAPNGPLVGSVWQLHDDNTAYIALR